MKPSRDFSDREFIERIFPDPEERHRIFTELINDMIYSMKINPDGSIVGEWVSKSFTDVMGYSLKEIDSELGMNRTLHPEDREIVLNSFLEAIKTKREKVMGLEFRVCGKDKSIYWVELNSNIQFNEEGNYMREEGVLRDITEKKETERALIESEGKFRNLFETSKDVISISSSEGRFLDINQAGEELFGYTREELLELDLNDLRMVPDIS